MPSWGALPSGAAQTPCGAKTWRPQPTFSGTKRVAGEHYSCLSGDVVWVVDL